MYQTIQLLLQLIYSQGSLKQTTST